MQHIQGFVEEGNVQVGIGGSSVNLATLGQPIDTQQSFPGALVTVFNAGTTTLATIQADKLGTPKPNPFFADAFGYWSFYSGGGNFDVQFSGVAGLQTPFTLTDMTIPGSVAIGAGVAGASSGSVLFVDASGNLAQDNPNFFWDTGTHSLRVASPTFATPASHGLYMHNALVFDNQAAAGGGISQFDSSGSRQGILWLDGANPDVLHIRNNQRGVGGAISLESEGGGNISVWIDAQGRAGINVIPNDRLQVFGNVTVAGVAGAGFYLYNVGDAAATNKEYISLITASGPVFSLQSTAAGTGVVRDMAIQTGTTPGTGLYFRASTSTVGIGTTNPPVKLTVSNAGAEGLEVNPTGGNVSLQAYNRSGVAYAPMLLSASVHHIQIAGTDAMFINASSNVGIGTGNPPVKLTVSNAGAEGMEVNPTGGNVTLQAYNRSTFAYAPLLLSGSNVRFQVAGTDAMDVDVNSNVIVLNRLQTAVAYGVTAAATITLPNNGNVFVINGNTAISNIALTNWQVGSIIVLVFTGTPTLNEAAGGSGQILMRTGANLVVVAGTTHTFVLVNATSWYQVN